jgi:acyl-CoA thioester hydrolase
VARVAYLERYAGGYQAIRDRGLEALTTEVSLRYHRAAAFDELLTVWARCVDVQGARFTYEYRITRGDELVAEGHTRHATVDRDTYRPTRVPGWLAEAIATAESPAA